MYNKNKINLLKYLFRKIKEIKIINNFMIKAHFYYLAHFCLLFFLNIYIANHYLAVIFGEYQFYATLFAVLLAFSQVGTVQSFTIFAPKVPSSIKLVYAVIYLRFFGYIIVSFALLVIFFLLNLPSVAFVFLLWFFPLTMNFSTILDYYHKTIIDVKYNFIFDGLLFLCFCIIVINNDLSIIYIVFFRFLTKSIAEYMKYKYIFFTIGKEIYIKKYIKWMYKKSKVFISNRIIVDLYARSEILLLGIWGSKKEVGLYVVAYTIYNAILLGENLMSRKLFPQLAKVYNDDFKAKKILTLSILYKTLYYIPSILITYYSLNQIIFTFFYNRNEYFQSSVLLNLMLIGLISHIFANNTNYLLMTPKKFLYIKRFLIGLVLNVILGYLFYKYYSLEGYTLAIQTVKLIMVSYSVYLSYSIINERLKGREYVKK